MSSSGPPSAARADSVAQAPSDAHRVIVCPHTGDRTLWTFCSTLSSLYLTDYPLHS
jgi:hypothetical protein